MITRTTGNILHADVEAVVNTVNCVGVMGRGIALQFKKSYPDNFVAYERACRNDQVQPGHMFVTRTNRLDGPRFVVNFPTKRHWRGRSRMADIEAGLDDLARFISDEGIKSIAIPPLGSGLGGLEWAAVRPVIEAKLGELIGVEIILFEPTDTRMKLETSPAPPTMTPGRAALVGLMRRYLAGLMDPDVSLLEIHKLMYFLQEAGEPLSLRFTKALYGPYAENLRHVLTAIEGHYVVGYGDGGDEPTKLLHLTGGSAEIAESVIEGAGDTADRMNRVARLIDGFETPFGLELLATVHWAAQATEPADADAVREVVYGWNKRKRAFTPEQIELARLRLEAQGWLAAS